MPVMALMTLMRVARWWRDTDVVERCGRVGAVGRPASGMLTVADMDCV
jgi:hypothetical protein